MAQLIVRNLPDELVQELKQRAAAEGRSAEELHREILRVSLGRPSLKAMLLEMPSVGEDEDFARPAEEDREVDL